MKKKARRITEFESERNADLMQAYRKQIAKLYDETDHIEMEEVFRRTANAPAKRFYVTPERAAIVMSQIQKGQSLDGMTAERKKMFLEIYRRVTELKMEKSYSSWRKICREVVGQPAPSFYLSPGSVKVIIYKIMKGWYEERERKIWELFR